MASSKFISKCIYSPTTIADIERIYGQEKFIWGTYIELASLSPLLLLYKVISSPLIILYQTEENYGHWCCLWYNSYGLNFFDSYGIFPDDEKKATDYLDGIPSIALDIMYIAQEYIGIPLRYNSIQFQHGDSQVCGRWVAYRLRFQEFNEKQFADFIYYLSNKLEIPNLDRLICFLTT